MKHIFMEDWLQMISLYSEQGSPQQEGNFTCTPNPTLPPPPPFFFENFLRA